MTEEEWLSTTFALVLMQAADGKNVDENGSPMWKSVAARVACLERLGSDMPEGVRRWVIAAIAYLDEEDRLASADGLLYNGRDDVYSAFRDAYSHAELDLRQRLAAAQDVDRGTDYYAEDGYMLEEDESSPTYTGPVYAADSAAHCHIIRDIFGNPFRAAVFDPGWRTSDVVSLAESAYGERYPPRSELENDRLAILSDALEEAGCDAVALLDHLRSLGPHVRGCWGVDLVLGKTDR